jgi:hypothetical protein
MVVKILMRLVFALLLFVVRAAEAQTPAANFQPVPELAYRVVPDFFKAPEEMTAGEGFSDRIELEGAHLFVSASKADALRI